MLSSVRTKGSKSVSPRRGLGIGEIRNNPGIVNLIVERDQRQVMQAARLILAAKQVVFTACGSSRHAALIGRYLFSRLAGKFCDVVIASEFHYFSESIDPTTVVIAIAQGGEEEDVSEGVLRARERGAVVISIAATPGCPLDRVGDLTLYLCCSRSTGAEMTPFVAQLTVLYMLAFAMAGRLSEGTGSLSAVGLLMERNARQDGLRLDEVGTFLRREEHFYYIAKGINFAIVAEGALKAKELAGVHAEGMAAGELKHGALALIERNTPVVVICPEDGTFQETIASAEETRARGALNIGVSNVDNRVFDWWVGIPKVNDIFYPLVAVLPLQLLAFHLGEARKAIAGSGAASGW